MRNSYFIPKVLISGRLDKSVQVLLESDNYVQEGVHWSTKYNFGEMLISAKLSTNKSGAAKKKVSEILTRNSISYLDETSSFNPHVFGRIADTKIGEGILDSGSFGYIANYISFNAHERLAKLGLATAHKCKEARVCSLSSCFMNDSCTTFSVRVV